MPPRLPSFVRSPLGRLRDAVHPGHLLGIDARSWVRVLRRNAPHLRRRDVGRVLGISACSVFNSAVGTWESVRHGRRIRRTPIPPPIFVLGHWRSGTTFLHGLLAEDDRFAYPNYYEVISPHTFLTTRLNVRLFESSGGTRLTDRVAFDLEAPHEDEFALAPLTGESLYLGMDFPRDPAFPRFLTLEDASPGERERWKAALEWFYRKLSLRYGRPLLLKSPGHTCRIDTLLELFPDARFVHVHRDPFVVLQSSYRLAHARQPALKQGDQGPVWGGLIAQYQRMYEAFDRQRPRIPAGRFHELAFESLEADPVGRVRDLYSALDLPDFEHVRPRLERHVAALGPYRKTEHAPLPPLVREVAERELERWISAWGSPGLSAGSSTPP